MEIHSMRIEHGPIQTNTMSYPQRQTQNHRPNHNQTSLTADIYKPSRSPLSTARYPYPSSPQLQQSTAPTINQVQIPQRYQVPPTSAPPPVSAPPPSSAAAPQPAPPPQLLSGVFREYRQNRISLLHPEYGPGRADRATSNVAGGGRIGGDQPTLHGAPPAGVVCVDSGSIQGGGQPLKKIRLQDKEGMQPLRIDTRPGMYNPQVEAISPILPDQMTQDDQAFRTTKDELIQQIGKVDREIAKAESQIAILKKKQAELEEIANKPAVKPEIEEDTTPKHQSLPQKIYAENRKKAQSAHAQLDSLGPKVEWPLYNQPGDAKITEENEKRYLSFKNRLVLYFKKKHDEIDSRNAYLSETYSKMMQEWLRKVEKIESSTKRKAKEAKNREFFEKFFPELRKQREDKERFNRVGARVKSEADMEEIMDNLQEQALEDKKMRSYAVIPPILLDVRERRIKYENHNGYIENMEDVYKSRQFLNVWTPSEKEIFKEKYLQHPKNFVVISSYLDRKSVADCVQYYYLSKKTENYKQLFRRARQRTRNRTNAQKLNSSNASVADILTTGVTTRLQREQQARTGVQQLVRDSNQTLEPAASTTPPATSTTGGCSTPTSVSSPPSSNSTTQSATTLTSSVTTSSITMSTMVDSPSPPTTSDVGTPSVVLTTSTVSTTVSCSTTSANTTTTNSSVSINTSVISTSSNSVELIQSVAVSASGVSAPSSELVIPMDTNEDDKSKVKTFLGFGAMDDFQNSTKFFPSDVSEVGGSKELASNCSRDSSNISLYGQNVHRKAELKLEVGSIKKESEPQQESISEQNVKPGTPLIENKKKKERRKEKDSSAIETSDEEANNSQDKTIQGSCTVCQSQLGSQLHSRPLMPSQAMQYGLREDQILPNSRVCNTCHCKILRSHYTHCPLPACPNSRGRVKRLRSLPYRLQDLPSDVKESLMAEFRIPSGVTKCCSACFNRIQRRLGPVEDWPEEDFNKLKVALSELGSNWQLIGERLNKPPQKVKMFCAAHRKRLKGCLGEDRKPTLSTDEESGSSTSSCEESLLDGDRHSSDTASAAESPPVQGSGDNAAKRVDYDSSATETADEAQTPDHYQGSATITPVNNDGQSRQNASLSVKDLVLNMIEISLMKNSGGQQTIQNPPTSGITPTISSILNNDSNEVTIVSEYNLSNMTNQTQRPQTQPRSDINIAKLVNPLIAATITPVTGPIPTQPQPEPIQASRDDLVVLQVPDGREPETLDLSIKKPREPLPPPHSKHQQPPQQPQIHRSEPSYNIYHQERKSPAFSIRNQPKLPSPKPANPKAGSITLGTPVLSQAARYDVLRQMGETKMGSITQGTPIQMPHNMQDKRVYDYMNKRNSMPPQQNQTQQHQYPGQYRQAAYTMEQQLNSRQTIINDYITSQQMLGRRNEKPQYYPTNSPHRTPPPAQQSQQQRQGVIQRHTRPQYLQPGQEVLSTFVDLAVQQPSLPVPNAPHEGLGKTMADNIMEQPHRYQLFQQQQQQQQQQQLRQQQHRLEEQRRAAVFHQQQNQQVQQRQQARSDSSTLTAASLIDAIITHQINQTAEGPREVVTSAREQRAGDLLFQNFHRGDPPQTPQSQQVTENSDGRPPSVISVDLDGESVNKNLTVKELTDSVISHDFGARQASYYHLQENMNDQWKRRIQQQQQQKDDKRSQTPQQQDERQIIRIAQPQQKYHLERVEPVSPPENNHWSDQNYRRYPQSQPHISPLDYVKNRIVEVMRTEDDKKDNQETSHNADKDRSDSPGDMVIDEEKHDNDFVSSQPQQSQHQQQPSSGFYTFVHKDSSTANDNSRNNEPKPLLSAQYDPLSDEDE